MMKMKLTKSPMERIAELETLLNNARYASAEWQKTASQKVELAKFEHECAAANAAEMERLRAELLIMVGERNKRLAEIAALQEKRRCANQRETYRSGLVAGLERAIALQSGGKK